MISKISKMTIILVSLYFLGAAPAANYVTKTNMLDDESKKVEKEFKVKYGQEVELDLKTGSSIKITGWDKELLKITATLKGEDADKVELEFHETSDGVTITTDYESHYHNMSTDGDIVIFAPKKFNIVYDTMGGSVKIKNIEGKIEGSTKGGGITLSELNGVIDVSTMGGDISISDSDLDGEALTMGGDVTMKNLTGDVNVKTMGGDVHQSNVKGRSGVDKEEVNVTSMGGDLSVDEAPNGCRLKTMGGDITINSAEKYIYAETMGGDVKVKKSDGEVKVTTMGGDVSVKILDKTSYNHDVDLKSMGGDIQLYLPDNFDMTVSIEIRYNEESKRARIVGDFKIDEEIEDDGRDGEGRKTMILRGTAVFGSGKNKVKIKTVNGEVKLIKS